VGKLPKPGWVFFASRRLNRSLVIVHEAAADCQDQYWPMENNMVVFGYGRQYKCCDKYLSAVPASFTLGFVESAHPAEIKKLVKDQLYDYTLVR
jgi:hypothetical protein